MKIAQVLATFPLYSAGTDNACYRNTVEFAKQGCDVTVFASEYPNENCNILTTSQCRTVGLGSELGSAFFRSGYARVDSPIFIRSS